MGRQSVSDEMGGVTNGKVLLVGLFSSSQSLDQLALTFGEFMRINGGFGGRLV